MEPAHSTGKYLIWLAIIAVVCAVLYGLSIMYTGSLTGGTATTTDSMEPPPYTEEIDAQLKASKGFSLLVSYTDGGFEPQTAEIEKGETVRFTNNSSHDMWVAASGEMGSVYPGPGTCGQSAFDICKAIGRGMFYEFTFDEAGIWGYHDNSEPIKTGKVVVSE